MKIRTLILAGIAGLALSACSTTSMDETSSDMYRIKDGESLMIIAEDTYGSRRDWVKIYEANKDTIADPALVYPGQMIVLPE
jgi:nucleoid-associated protein YgaU